MKKPLITLAISMAGLLVAMQSIAQTNSQNNLSFTIRGDIQGLMPGDTLSFKHIILPQFDREPAFDVIVEHPEKFEYSGTQQHTGMYLMSYHPASGKEVKADRSGLELLIKEGTTLLTGTAAHIYYAHRQGGIYNNESLQEIIQLDSSLGKDRGDLARFIDEARHAGDTAKMKEYAEQFNSFHVNHREEFKKLSELETEFFKNFPSSEYTVVNALRGATYKPFEETKGRYESMNEEAKNSNYGKLVKDWIDKLARLQPGEAAPDFHLIAMDGRELSLSDCAESYVLIYHWGLCPGSLMIDQQVIDLYNKYKDRVKFIGVTEKMSYIKSYYEDVKSGDKFRHIELKPVLENMLAHPWFDVEKTPHNKHIETDYAVGGLPYFVFISPEGKIIARDFHNAFYTAKKILDEQGSN